MSQRKRAAVAAALAAQEKTASTTTVQRRWHRLTKPSALAVIGLSALLAVGVLGATISVAGDHEGSGNNPANSSLFGNLFSSAPAAATTAAATNPALMPTPMPTPQLSKEYLYAGGRLLATEDGGAPNSSSQPADLVVWRPTSGQWWVRDSNNSSATNTGIFGQSGDKPVLGDFDGDGLYDFAVFRPSNGTWYILPSGGGSYYGSQFGLSDDVPAPADYDGDGRADIAVWRNSDAKFYILQSSNNQFIQVPLGQNGDVPVSADYDGDGRADVALFRRAAGTGGYSQWLIRQSSNNQLRSQEWGEPSLPDLPTSGDYDGDGKMDLAICRLGTNQWWIMPSSTGAGYASTFSTTMTAGDQPVQGDYDGDGKTDAAIWRPSNGTWYIRQSRTNVMRTDQWGQLNDVPLPAPMIR